jgi:hypothetical protein
MNGRVALLPKTVEIGPRTVASEAPKGSRPSIQNNSGQSQGPASPAVVG